MCYHGARSRAKVGKFNWYSDSPGGRMTGWSSSQGCFLVNLDSCTAFGAEAVEQGACLTTIPPTIVK